MNRERIRKMLEELETMVGIQRKVRLELRPLKTKAASVSLKRNVIRLSRDLVSRLSEEHVKYLILHELVHLKLRTIHHTNDFYRVVNSVFTEDEVKKLEEDILTRLLELNNGGIRRARDQSGAPF